LEPMEPMEPLALEGIAEPFHVALTAETPHVLTCNGRLELEVRVQNNTAHLLTSHAPNPVQLSYHWLHEDGSMAFFESERTPLIPPLEPQHARHYIAKINAPGTPGFYKLQPVVVQEHVQWFDQVSRGVFPLFEVREASDQ
jgi:hypothetical protein